MLKTLTLRCLLCKLGKFDIRGVKNFIMTLLSHSFLIYSFSSLWKHQKTLVFGCLQGVEKGCIGDEWVKRGEFTRNHKNNQRMENIQNSDHIFWILIIIFTRKLHHRNLKGIYINLRIPHKSIKQFHFQRDYRRQNSESFQFSLRKYRK